MRCSWLRTIFEVLLVAAIPMHVWTYKILMLPVPGKSHVFSMAAIAESLVNEGHKVIFFIGENYPLSLPELRNRSEFSVFRYRDTTNGVPMDYDAMAENITRSAIEANGNMKQLGSAILKMCVNLRDLIICPIARTWHGT